MKNISDEDEEDFFGYGGILGTESAQKLKEEQEEQTKKDLLAEENWYQNRLQQDEQKEQQKEQQYEDFLEAAKKRGPIIEETEKPKRRRKPAIEKEELRKHKPQSTGECAYDVNQEPIVISKVTSDILLQQINSGDLISLYWFYYYTAKWQKTNNAFATTSYTAKGLNWSQNKVRRIKKQLTQLKLIEEKQIKKEKTGHFGKRYIQVNFIWWDKDKINNHHPHGFPKGGDEHSLENPRTNALTTSSLNALNTYNLNKSLLHKDDVFGKHQTSVNKIISFWNTFPKTQTHLIPAGDEDKFTKTYKTIFLQIENLLSGKPLVRNKDNSPSKLYKDFLHHYDIPEVLHTKKWTEKEIIDMLQIFYENRSDDVIKKTSLNSLFWNRFANRGGGFSWFIKIASETDIVSENY